MNARETIERADALLPGKAAPDGQNDPRWQAIIAVAEFIDDEPEIVWSFVERWGRHPDEDLRAAIATCCLEHLLERHFDLVFPRVEPIARSNDYFAQTIGMCWRFGESKHPENAARLWKLQKELKKQFASAFPTPPRPARRGNS